ncbi:MAG: DUF5320 family protein [Patescibacteria group bacterium]|nr:DUF5320 family protein [Patescibacteria group bacterium]
MPLRDGTGPQGQGPGTGRGMGPCVQGRGFRGRGFGRGFGRGQGIGFGRMFWTRQDWREDLTAYKQDLERELEAVNQELNEVEK